jgi:hypothetical protein
MKVGARYSTYNMYTDESIRKTVFLNVLLVSLIISKVGFWYDKAIQGLVETWKLEHPIFEIEIEKLPKAIDKKVEKTKPLWYKDVTTHNEI